MSSIPQNVVSLDRRSWTLARTAGLAQDVNGELTLARAPAVAPGGAPIDLPEPYDVTLVGFAVSECGELVFALPDAKRIVIVDPLCGDDDLARACGSDAAVAGVSGLAVFGRRLYAAAPADRGVHVFTLPALELSATWTSAAGAPLRVAVDATGRIYVLDTAAPRLARLRRDGRLDAQYASSTAAALSGGLDLCVSADGRASVSVAGQPDILRFESSGSALPAIAAPADAPGFRPGALASDGRRLYVADRASGGLWMYDLDGERWLGPLPGFRAPVTGLAVDVEGHLYVRTGAGTQYVRLEARGAHVLRGQIEAGPLDAGRGNAWMRVHVETEVPPGTRVVLETALAELPGAAPPLVRQPARDVLVHAPEAAGMTIDPAARFLWIRVRLETDDPMISPRVRAVVAETPGENYLEYVPNIYARADAETGAGGGGGTLRASLETARAELGDREAEITGLAARLDPAVAPPDHLPWLATWIAADLPPQASVTTQRNLLLDAHHLYERRGTIAGLREMVRLYTGVDCEISESFRERRLWMLDVRACLGFDTGLLSALPDGMVVPGPAVLDPALQGLSASYFLDDHFGRSADPPGEGDNRCEPFSPAPPIIDRDGRFRQFAPPTGVVAFSVVWTGQVFARFSEVYTFYFKCDGGARIYVDGELIIDSWITPTNREPRGSLPLTRDRWYPIRIEYWSKNPASQTPILSWSSRSQPKEPIQQEFLYAVDNDNVAPDVGAAPPLIVGDALVGQQGPLAAEDFGAPLFADTAHLFTVRLQARDARRAGVLDAVRAVLDAEKPAHTDYHLCVVEPTFVVGRQARVGVDAVVPHTPAAGRYDEAALGRDARLGAARAHADTLRVEENLRIGANAILR